MIVEREYNTQRFPPGALYSENKMNEHKKEEGEQYERGKLVDSAERGEETLTVTTDTDSFPQKPRAKRCFHTRADVHSQRDAR